MTGKRRWPARTGRWCAAAVVVAATLTIAGASRAAATDSAVVRTDHGPVRGVVADRTRSFQGIPYAAPPLGQLRWHNPVPAPRWSGVRDASTPGWACAQLEDDVLAPRSSEDCLYLNVTTPRTAPERLRPVIVYLHGGAFSSGAGSDFNATRMAATGDTVVVTVNSRLGIFGFFGHPDLDDSGTYGLADQQAALRWIRANARAFGADPHNVTLMGQSSGGASVCAQLTSPAARGLFQRAIIQSGSCPQRWAPNVMTPDSEPISYWAPRHDVQQAGAALSRRLCGAEDAVTCLRRTDPMTLLARSGQFLRPAYDTRTLPLDPVRALQTGAFARVPVLQGNTRDEHRLFAALFEDDEPMDEAGYRANVVKSFGADQAPRILARYPPAPPGRYSAGLAWGAVGTDASWVCPTLRADRLLAARVPVYSFEFADPGVLDIVGTFPPNYPSGAYHGSELPLLFDLGDSYGQLTPSQRQLSDTMIRYWTRFARTGNPNSGDLPHWKRFDTNGSATTQVFDSRSQGIDRIDAAAEHQCAFWRPSDVDRV